MAEKRVSIGRLVSILNRAGQSYLGRRLEPHGIGSGQVPFLAELFGLGDGLSQDDLAAHFQCDKATASRALKRLESEGYVERRRSAEDGRVNRVYLTPKARAFQDTLFGTLSGWTEVLSAGLSTAERRELVRLLEKLVDNAAAAKTATITTDDGPPS